jgi:hypothetical protein
VLVTSRIIVRFVVEEARITSGMSPDELCLRENARQCSVTGVTMLMFLPSIHPALLRDSVNAFTYACGLASVAAPFINIPTRRMWSGCCAYVATDPRVGAAAPRNELPPFHSITSSAIATSVGGTSMPRSLAVCRLITNSNRVDCRTGRSDGLVPFRMPPT